MPIKASAIVDLRRTDIIDSRQLVYIYTNFLERLRSTISGSICVLTKGRAPDIEAIDAIEVLDSPPRGIPHCSRMPLVIFPDGCAWVDKNLPAMLNGVPTDGAVLFAYQPGYDLLVCGPDLKADFSPPPFDFRAWIRQKSKKFDNFKIFETPFGQKNVYLQTDLPHTRNLLSKLYSSNEDLREGDLKFEQSVFRGNNYKNIARTLARIDALFGLRGKRVLEIGASVTLDIAGRLVVEEYGAHYTGNNIIPFQYNIPTAQLLVGDAHSMEFEPEKFDLIYSIGVMEHMPDPLGLLKKSEDWLAHGGVHFGRFQIWSGAYGHHIYSPRFPAHLVPDYAQLTMTADEMRALLAGRVEQATIDAMIEMTYTGNEINRCGIEQYFRYFAESKLDLIWLEGLNRGMYDKRAINLAKMNNFNLTAEYMSCHSLEFALRKSDYSLRRLVCQH